MISVLVFGIITILLYVFLGQGGLAIAILFGLMMLLWMSQDATDGTDKLDQDLRQELNGIKAELSEIKQALTSTSPIPRTDEDRM